jgi:murein DD-endopeptidase MepM/ murein hydrolase activator NlpD
MFSNVLAAVLFLAPPAVRPIVPVAGPIVQRFVAPACQRCSGHRGVSIASPVGQPVRAVLPGVITFVGQVAGKTYVVEQVAPGVKVTYGWLDLTAGLAEGDAVMQGQVVGTAGDRTYLGVRVGSRYVEPLRFLGLGWARLQGPGGVVVGRTGSAR